LIVIAHLHPNERTGATYHNRLLRSPILKEDEQNLIFDI